MPWAVLAPAGGSGDVVPDRRAGTNAATAKFLLQPGGAA